MPAARLALGQILEAEIDAEQALDIEGKFAERAGEFASKAIDATAAWEQGLQKR